MAMTYRSCRLLISVRGSIAMLCEPKHEIQTRISAMNSNAKMSGYYLAIERVYKCIANLNRLLNAHSTQLKTLPLEFPFCAYKTF